MLTIENNDSDLKVQELHYANELLVRVRLAFKNFCKLAKQVETIRNYQKQVFVIHKYIEGPLFFFPALFPAIAVKNPQDNLAILTI